jgi:hypothetical protein
MTPKTFSIGEAVGFGWDVAKKNIGFFVVAFIIVIVAQAIVTGVQQTDPRGVIGGLFALVNIFVSGVVTLGWIKIALRFCDREQPQYADLYTQYPLFFRYLGAAILYALIVVAGVILLVVPGIIWAIQFGYAFNLIVDRRVGVMESLRLSSAITRGVKWNLFLFVLILVGVNLLGALALLIGLLWTVPASFVASVYVYRKLLAQTATTPAPAG